MIGGNSIPKWMPSLRYFKSLFVVSLKINHPRLLNLIIMYRKGQWEVRTVLALPTMQHDKTEADLIYLFLLVILLLLENTNLRELHHSNKH